MDSDVIAVTLYTTFAFRLLYPFALRSRDALRPVGHVLAGVWLAVAVTHRARIHTLLLEGAAHVGLLFLEQSPEPCWAEIMPGAFAFVAPTLWCTVGDLVLRVLPWIGWGLLLYVFVDLASMM